MWQQHREGKNTVQVHSARRRQSSLALESVLIPQPHDRLAMSCFLFLTLCVSHGRSPNLKGTPLKKESHAKVFSKLYIIFVYSSLKEFQ
jgi:hypothetical protein